MAPKIVETTVVFLSFFSFILFAPVGSIDGGCACCACLFCESTANFQSLSVFQLFALFNMGIEPFNQRESDEPFFALAPRGVLFPLARP